MAKTDPELQAELQEQLKESAWLDFMEARQRALEAATGYFVGMNIPTKHLQVIVDQHDKQETAESIVYFAAQIVLHQRGGRWEKKGK